MVQVAQETSDAAGAARRRAYAALLDEATNEELMQERVSFLTRQGTVFESGVVARAAAAGVELSGSPLLAQLHGMVEVQRQIANQQLQQQFVSRRFLFEAEEELLRAQALEQGLPGRLRAIRSSARVQARAAQHQAAQSILGGTQGLTSLLSSPTVRSLLPSGGGSRGGGAPARSTPVGGSPFTMPSRF